MINKININSEDSIYLKKVKESKDTNQLNEYYKALNHKRPVDIVQLDDYMESLGIEYVDLLKVDTQGYEPEVLSGLGNSLSRVGVVITELMFYDYYERDLSFSDIESYLLPAGFKLYDISHIAKNPMNGRTDWVDVIYVNQQNINNI